MEQRQTALKFEQGSFQATDPLDSKSMHMRVLIKEKT